MIVMTETQRVTVLGISGSLRRASYNTGLLRVAAELAPPHVSIELADISEIPLYNADVERDLGFPEAASRFRDQIGEADGLLIATPEYNWSVTGVLKNAIDWASRHPSPLEHKPAAILGTGGSSGTARAQRHLRDILGHNRLQVIAQPEVMLAGARHLFVDGTLADPDARGEIRDLLGALVRSIQAAEAA